jgi:hypothetical protein
VANKPTATWLSGSVSLIDCSCTACINSKLLHLSHSHSIHALHFISQWLVLDLPVSSHDVTSRKQLRGCGVTCPT